MRRLLPFPTIVAALIVSALLIYLAWAFSQLGGRSLFAGRERAEPTAEIIDETRAGGSSRESGPPSAEEIELDEIELESDQDTWRLSQRLLHGVSYEAVKIALPGLSNLTEGDGSQLTYATLDLEIVGASFTVKLDFRNRAWYEVTYLYDPAPGEERYAAVSESIQAQMSTRYGEPLHDSYAGPDDGTVEAYRWVGGSVVVDLVETWNDGTASIVVSVDSQ